MAGTNVLQWNPTGANQETDAQYLADSQRAGGATNPSLFDARLANKLFYQLTTYMEALFTAFANKGFATSDADLSALITQCANFVTTADLLPGLQNVLYAPVVQFNCLQATGFQVTLIGDIGVNVAWAHVGQTITFAFTQDGVGNHNVSTSANVVSMGTPSKAANATSVQTFIVLGDNKLHPIGPMVVS